MKVKGGSIYYFVKAGKISGWINKKSVKLVNNKVSRPEQPTKVVTPKAPITTPTNVPTTKPTSVVNSTPQSSNTSIPSVSANNSGSQNASQVNSDPNNQYVTGYIIGGKVTKGNKKVWQKSYDQKNSHIHNGAVVYGKTWKDGKLVETNLVTVLPENTPVQVLLNHDNPTSQLLVRTLDGKFVGYVDREQVSVGNSAHQQNVSVDTSLQNVNDSSKDSAKPQQGKSKQGPWALGKAATKAAEEAKKAADEAAKKATKGSEDSTATPDKAGAPTTPVQNGTNNPNTK